MSTLCRWSVLLAAALCVPAGDLAAQRTQQLGPRTAESLQDEGVTLRVNRTGVDTVTRVQGTRVRPGDMIVNVTGERPQRIQPSVQIPRRPPLVAAAPPAPEAGSTRPDEGSSGTPEPPKREEPEREEPGRQEPAPDPAPAGRDESSAADAGGPTAEDGSIAYAMSSYEIATTGVTGGRVYVLTPIVEIEGGGLRWDARQNAYVGSILIGLLDNDDPSVIDSLARAVVVQITGDVQSMEAVHLRNINLPFLRIPLVIARPRADSVLVRLRPTFDPRGGSVIYIPILRSPFALRVSPRRIAGFGLEIGELLVQARRGGEGLPVIVSSDRAKPKPAQLKAAAEGSMSRIRSSGVGEDTIRVASGDFEETVVIRYVWPIAFLLAALFGGLVGGVLNALSTKRRSNPRIVAFLGGQGALTGGVAAVLYAVGINVVGWAPSAEYGEGLMFAVAFIAGLMGPRIFDRFMPRLSVGRKDGGGAKPPAAPPPPAPAAPAAPEPTAVG